MSHRFDQCIILLYCEQQFVPGRAQINMGQFSGQPATEESARVEYDEESENGFVFCEKHLPEELIVEIFSYTDYDSLLNCQLVCKRWKTLITDYVWRKKAEAVYGKSLPPYTDMLWCVYCLMCKKRIFERNLLKNHSGEEGLKKHWRVTSNGGDGWIVENPPVGVPPLPNDPVFEKKEHCFATSYDHCMKTQKIDLLAEGFIPHILDVLMPPIVISEWYSSRWDCPATYRCIMQLFGEKDTIIDSIEFSRSIKGDDQNKWHYITHEFQDYGPGLRKIVLIHGGKDESFWAGHYGAKMAGASVCVKFPIVVDTDTEEGEMSDVD